MSAVCLCGCGEQVARRFKQGHDARWVGGLLRQARAGEISKGKAVATARKVSDRLAAKVERGLS